MPDSKDLKRLVGLYYLEDYLFNTVSPRFQAEGTLSDYDFYAIVIWKSNRTKTKIKRGLAEAGMTAGELMAQVADADTLEARVEMLLQIWGIGIAMASALLTVCYPDTFSVLDYRAWDTLTEEEVEDLPQWYPWDAASYVQYCRPAGRWPTRPGCVYVTLTALCGPGVGRKTCWR